MKSFRKNILCLSLGLCTVLTGVVMAAGTTTGSTGTGSTAPPPVVSITNNEIYVTQFNPAVSGGIPVTGGLVFRNAEYDSTHYVQSIASAFRITPNGGKNSTLTGPEIDRGEVVVRLSRNSTVYAECTMRRAFNDDFDHFVSITLASQGPQSTGPELIISPPPLTPGTSRSFVNESRAFSADNVNFFYKANDGICNVNFDRPESGTNIIGGIPAVQVGDTADVYIVNMNYTNQSSTHVATGIINSNPNY